MMSLTCHDLGDASCNYKATGNSAAEVEGKMIHHAKEHHMDKMHMMGEQDAIGMMNAMHARLEV